MNWEKNLNLGWLLFETTKGVTLTPPTSLTSRPEWQGISDRIVLVTPKLFSQIVNSNLEVRTSVSICPETGAAEPHALFTYEAIPRTTWLWSDVIEDDYKSRNGKTQFPQTDKQCKIERTRETVNGKPVEVVIYTDNGDVNKPLGETWSRPLDVVLAGMRLIEYLGIGGMGTRGFGRMRLVDPSQASNGGGQ